MRKIVLTGAFGDLKKPVNFLPAGSFQRPFSSAAAVDETNRPFNCLITEYITRDAHEPRSE